MPYPKMAGNKETKMKRKPVIIAMKGHPGTGKSTLAKAISADLMCPLLDKDDIYAACSTLIRHLHPSSTSRLINDLSYDSLYNLTSTQLRLGLSVVVDSPLSSRSRLDRLLKIADSNSSATVVVECKPGDESEWRRRLEQRGETGEASWHKPATWHDLERLIESYGGCYEYDTGDVPKMVMDTTAQVDIKDVVAFVRSNSLYLCN